MKRGLRQKSGGFTILETIIVLTVTIALLGSTLALFQSRVPKTQFTKAVNELSVQLTDVSNQVAVGNYPGASDTKCSVSSGVPTLNTGGSGMGTNQDCIFLGQAVGAKSKEQLKVYTIFGSRLKSSGEAATKLAEANPTSSVTYATQDYTTGFGLEVTKITDQTRSYGGVAYIQSFGSGINVSGEAEGSQQVDLMPVSGNVGDGDGAFVSAISSIGTIAANPASGITICLKSGTTNQYAVLVLGANGNATDVQQRIVGSTEWGNYGC